jgi:serine/threonine protein kinase
MPAGIMVSPYTLHEGRCVLLEEQSTAAMSGAIDFPPFAPLRCDDFSLAEAAAGEFQPASVIANRFRIIRFVDRGGMGEVYEAKDLAITSQPNVALKIIRRRALADTALTRRLKQETEFGRAVTHPNVCRVYDLGFHSVLNVSGNRIEIPFLTMEFLSGCTLAGLLRKEYLLSASRALPIVRQIAAALDAVHAAGIIHCDVKPANIMLVPVDNQRYPKAVLCDFGLAERYPGHSAPGECSSFHLPAGTPDYMSPEQVMGGVLSPSSDIYSLGLLIYRILTGVLPFAGADRTRRMTQRLEELPMAPRLYVPKLHARWEAVVLRCLAPDPTRRFACARHVIRALTSGSDRRVEAAFA